MRFNKFTSVFHASVLLLIMNFVITVKGSCGSPRGSPDYFEYVMTKFIVNNRTDALTDINLFFTKTSCQIVPALVL